MTLVLLGVQQPSPRRRGLPAPDAPLLPPLGAASWGGGGDIRGAASSDSDSLKDLVPTLTQEQTSREVKKALWMPSPSTPAGRHSGLPQPQPQPPVAAAGAPPWVVTVRVPETGRRRPRPPPRRKAKGTHRGEEVEEEEEAAVVLAAARVDGMLLVWLQQLAGY